MQLKHLVVVVEVDVSQNAEVDLEDALHNLLTVIGEVAT